ncbi:MAG: hypothetical protein BMS9Abin29_2533 [Gemmatimonadota bacterium]|nr:MAG: hypothetical protein BMS9Abin29_2533 [Gemmatimonadota bacterium]
MFNKVLTLSAALLLWAPSLGAQQSHEHASGEGQEAGMKAGGMMASGGMGQGMKGMMGGGMGMMSSSAPGPAMLIRMGTMLGLTEKQTTDLKAIQAELADNRTSHMPLVKQAHERAAASIAGDETDLAAYEAALREAMDHMVSVHVSVARAAVDARALLNDEQRARLEGATAMMRHMEGMKAGGMHGTPGQDAGTAGHEHGKSSGG